MSPNIVPTKDATMSCPLYMNEFTHKGPNGEHVCLVFDVMGYHLGHQAFHFKGKRLPVKSVKSIARQILLALDFLHTECGIIHTGMVAHL